MSDVITDQFGRVLGVDIIKTTENGEDIYTATGIILSFPEGTCIMQVMNSFNGMAPEGWVFPAPAEPTLSDLQAQLAAIAAQIAAMSS